MYHPYTSVSIRMPPSHIRLHPYAVIRFHCVSKCQYPTHIFAKMSNTSTDNQSHKIPIAIRSFRSVRIQTSILN